MTRLAYPYKRIYERKVHPTWKTVLNTDDIHYSNKGIVFQVYKHCYLGNAVQIL